jgi:triacylglycerol esterase/lipase EstA (alpha/beta hydrolase family)
MKLQKRFTQFFKKSNSLPLKLRKKLPKKYFFVLVHGLMGSPLDFLNFKTELSKKFKLKNTFIVNSKLSIFQVKFQSQSVRKNR